MNDEVQIPDTLPQTEYNDWFLQSLVNISTNASLNIGITLQVSGMLVSGQLVGGQKYFEAFAEELSAGCGDLDPDSEFKKIIASFGDRYKPDPTGEEKRPLPHYIHLKNARFFNTSGKPIPGNRGVWWRGRLCEVGGFILGELKAEAP